MATAAATAAARAHSADTGPTGPFGLRLGSLIRAAGTTATILSGRSPGVIRTGLLAGGAYLAAREVDPAGLQILSVTPHGDINVISAGTAKASDAQAELVQVVTSTASWVGANLLAAKVARVLPWSRPVTAVLVGAGVFLADDALSSLVAKAVAAREASPASDRPPAG
jgi:hypothetical protein